MADETKKDTTEEQAQLEINQIYRRAKRVYIGFFVASIILIMLSVLTMMPFGFLSAFGTSLWAINFVLGLSGVGCLIAGGITYFVTRLKRWVKNADKSSQMVKSGQKKGHNLSERELMSKRTRASKFIEKLRCRAPHIAKMLENRINTAPANDPERIKNDDGKKDDEDRNDENHEKSWTDINKDIKNDKWFTDEVKSESENYTDEKKAITISKLSVLLPDGNQVDIPLDFETKKAYEFPLAVLKLEKYLNEIKDISGVAIVYDDAGTSDSGKVIFGERTKDHKDLFSEEDMAKQEKELEKLEKPKKKEEEETM